MVSNNLLILLGSAVPVAGAGYAILLWIKRRYDSVMQVFTGLASVSTTVEVLTTNHLPHIQASLNETVNAVANLQKDISETSTDVKGIGVKVVELVTAQDLMKTGLHNLGQSFITHLENASAESIHARANIARQTLQIDAILQAEKVKQATLDVALNVPPIDVHKEI